MTKITLALLAIATSALAGITTERPVSTPVLTAAPGNQFAPAVASDGSGYLAVWNDERGGFIGAGRTVLYATRIDPNGSVLDPTGIRIDGTPAAGSPPAVVFAGGTYSVFWTEQAFDPGFTTLSIHVARIDRDGNIVDPPRLLLAKGAVAPARIASSGNRIAIYDDLQITILDANAQIIGKSIPLGVPSPAIVPAAVTSNGSSFLAVWYGAPFFGLPTINARFLDLDGQPLSPALLVPVQVRNGQLSAASNGSDYLVVAYDQGLYSSVALSGTAHTVSPAQNLGTPDAIPNETLLVPVGSNYVLAWTEYVPAEQMQGLFTQQLDASGARLDFGQQIAQQATSGPVALFGGASNGRTTYFAFSSQTGEARDFDIHGIGGNARTETLLSQSSDLQQNPDIATNGSNFLTVWHEGDGVYAARMTLDGQALDGRGIHVSDSTSVFPPKVVFDGANYVVVFERMRAARVNVLLAARIDPVSGALLDGDGAPLAGSPCDVPFDIGTDGTQTLAVFGTCSTNEKPQLMALRVNRAAQPVGVETPITPATIAAYDPSVAWSGLRWIVAFTELKYVPCDCLISPPFDVPVPVNIAAVRMTQLGTLIDTKPIELIGAPTETDPQAAPHVASSTRDFLVTWTRTTTREVRAEHITLDGAVGGDAMTIAHGTGTNTIWSGTRYAAAYTTPDGLASIVTLGTTETPGVNGALVINSGDNAQLVSIGDRLTAAYQRLATETIYGGVTRVFVRDAHAVHGHAVVR